MSTTLNIKIGQKWKTRSAGVATIEWRQEGAGEPYPWVASMQDGNVTYTVTGAGLRFGSGRQDNFDLIELVEDVAQPTGEAQPKKLGIKIGQRWKTRGGDVAEVHGHVRTSEGWRWRLHGKNIWLVNDAGCYAAVPNDYDLIELVEDAAPPTAELPKDEGEYTGGSVNYYRVDVKHPTSGGEAYTAECNDIIEALGMNHSEGAAFKAVWRRAASRNLGKRKKGYDNGLYDAEKIAFFGQRLVVQSKAESAK